MHYPQHHGHMHSVSNQQLCAAQRTLTACLSQPAEYIFDMEPMFGKNE